MGFLNSYTSRPDPVKRYSAVLLLAMRRFCLKRLWWRHHMTVRVEQTLQGGSQRAADIDLNIEPMLGQCWASVADSDPAHRVDIW